MVLSRFLLHDYMRTLLLISFCLLAAIAFAQPPYPVSSVSDERPTSVVFVNAVLHQDYQTTLQDATLWIEDGKVKQAGKDISYPSGIRVIDLKGKHIYPSFIDLDSHFGVEADQDNRSGLQYESNKKGPYYWNQAVHPEEDAFRAYHYDGKEAGELRKAGFGTVLTHAHNGIVRGTSMLVSLSDDKKAVLKEQAAQHFSFYKGNSRQEYPRSLMGGIALLRSYFLDLDWYAQNEGKLPLNLSLQAGASKKNLPLVFDAREKYNVLRASKVAQEFNLSFIYRGDGKEYQILDALAKLNSPMILPLNFPAPTEVSDPYDATWLPLKDAQYWELAPSNPRFVAQQNIPFALTTDGLKKKADFLKNLRKAVHFGLSQEDALKALTHTPANLLGASDLGALREGMLANFIITSDDIFKDKSIIHENWVLGKAYSFVDLDKADLAGNYSLQVDSALFWLSLKDKPKGFGVELYTLDSTKLKGKLKLDQGWLHLVFQPDSNSGTWRMAGLANDKRKLRGRLQDGKGNWLSWRLDYLGDIEADTTAKQEKDSVTFLSLPKRQTVEQSFVLFKNATVWTNEQEGILENTDVLIRNGKITQIGQNLQVDGATVIDATGKHLTCGIIDEHSHIAVAGGVNEASHAVTAEVRIGDVLNPEDINIYRQLASGVTAAQLLHGSANPVGGQSAIIKLRWGVLPEELKVTDAEGFIKFALGENVKQSNWGDRYTQRFPQTRMGVEQVYRDVFDRALAYQKEWADYNALSKKKRKKALPPRRDLTLETVLEVLNGKRYVTCHSYVQSEILMLMRVAEEYGFRINTFTHVLEGYKVAEQLKAHGAAASTFADWWAYKFEVNEAIPQNAPILHKHGVLTSLNSDFPEEGRRLSMDAAKMVKYGGISQEEAWKMVTLNPAKTLHLDDRMGSIKQGKDADVVLWSGNPLSAYSLVERTFVDGRELYSIEKEKVRQALVKKEKARLSQQMLQATENGDKPEPIAPTPESHYHCEDLEGYQGH